MRRDHQWQDARYSAEQRAYELGEYDGYWRQRMRTGNYPNTVWGSYLAGYLAGQRERNLEPTDEQLVEWMERIGPLYSDGER